MSVFGDLHNISVVVCYLPILDIHKIVFIFNLHKIHIGFSPMQLWNYVNFLSSDVSELYFDIYFSNAYCVQSLIKIYSLFLRTSRISFKLKPFYRF